MTTRLSDILRALEDRGGSLDMHDHAMLWIDAEDDRLRCYVRVRDIVRIEVHYHGSGDVRSRVIIAQPDGRMRSLIDKRRPKNVRRALERAEMAAAAALLDELYARFAGGELPD